MVSSLSAQLKDTRQELREKQKDKKEAERFWQNYKEDRETEGRRLRDSLQSRDQLIEVRCRSLPPSGGLKFSYTVAEKLIIFHFFYLYETCLRPSVGDFKGIFLHENESINYF